MGHAHYKNNTSPVASLYLEPILTLILRSPKTVDWGCVFERLHAAFPKHPDYELFATALKRLQKESTPT
jgi:hypothetical protein